MDNSQEIINILLKNGVDFEGVRVNISELLERARETGDFKDNFDFYKVILPIYKASIALEAGVKNLESIDKELLEKHIIAIVRAEGLLELMLDKVTDRTLGAKIIALLSQIIPVALLNELQGAVPAEFLNREEQISDEERWKGE